MELFQCPKIPGKLMLSEASCANNHLWAQKKDFQYRLPHCVECPIGAKNAGVKLCAPMEKRDVCVRCGCGDGRKVFGRLCMSCYNREREWRLGRNGKGAEPKEYKPLVLVTIHSLGKTYLVYAWSLIEAIAVAQKAWGLTEIVFDFRPAPVACQMSIFDEGRVIHVKTPCGGQKSQYAVVNGPKSTAPRPRGCRPTVRVGPCVPKLHKPVAANARQ